MRRKPLGEFVLHGAWLAFPKPGKRVQDEKQEEAPQEGLIQGNVLESDRRRKLPTGGELSCVYVRFKQGGR